MLLGVPEALLPAVRACSSEEALSRLIEWVPQSCVDGLILLADGRSIDEVIDELERKRPVNVDIADVATALDTPESQAEFMVITDDDVLEAMLSAPMEQWRVFCTPANGDWWREIGMGLCAYLVVQAPAKPLWRCTRLAGSQHS